MAEIANIYVYFGSINEGLHSRYSPGTPVQWNSEMTETSVYLYVRAGADLLHF